MLRLIDFNGEEHPISDYSRFHITHKLDGCDIMSFYLETTNEQYHLLQEESIIRTDQNEYLVKKIDDEKIDCQLNFDFLKARTYLNYRSETQSLTSVLSAHLPSGWTVEGASVSVIRRTIEFDVCTDYDVIYECMKVYGVKFVWKILEKRLIVFKPDLMPSTGEYVTTELNLIALSFKGQSTGFATRLYAYGKNGMTMEDAIIDGSRYGLTYVENKNYCNKVVCAVWKDERYTVKENLYEAAVEKLAEMAFPVRSYSCKVRDLAKQDDRYSFLTFSMHRKLTLIDIERSIRVEHQIVEYDEWPDEESQNTVTLSAVQDTIYTSIEEAIENGGQKAADDVKAELEEFIEGTYAEDIAFLQGAIDEKVETWYQETDPSSAWTTTAVKTKHIGDLWYKTTDSTTWRWNGTAWVEQEAPDAVFNAIEGKAQVFVTTPVPPYNVGDLWVQGANGDILRCQTAKTAGQTYAQTDWIAASKYTDDSGLSTFVTETYAQDLQNIQTSIDGKIETFYQSADPSTAWTTAEQRTAHVGDLWHRTSDNKTFRYNGTSWDEQAAPDAVFDAIDGKAQIFVTQPTPPYNVGDLWFNSSTSDILTCTTARTSGNYTAADWEKRNKYTDDSSLTTFLTTTYAQDLSSIQNQIDGKIETFYQSADPSTAWTTATAKSKHDGDLWYNTGTQLYYRYAYDSSTQTGSWEELTATPPSSIVTAINGKAQIFTSQPTPPYQVGDLWFNSSTSDIMTCITTRVAGNFVSGDWQKRNKYTDDSTANHVQSNLDDAVEELEGMIDDGDSEVTQALSDRLNMATALMTTAFGGNIYQYNGEMFIMDDPDPAQAEVVWRWNTNGFGKSSTGINGPYTMAMTVDDSFFANVISAMTIRGDLIQANTVTAEKIATSYTDGVKSAAFTAAKGYVDALFADLNTYLSNDGGTGQLDVLREDITDIQETIEGLSLDFSESFRGGINYCQNSAGLNGLSDDWVVTGTVAALQNNDTKNYTVSNSCFRVSANATLKQTIDSLVIGESYTISAKIKKTGSLTSEVYVVYNGSTIGKLFSKTAATTGWGTYSFTIEDVQSGTLEFWCTTINDYLYVSDIMVCEGVTSKAWTPAPDEIFTSGVKISKDGIRVYRSGTSEETVIDNHEFSGYYNGNLVFTLNKDETQLLKTYVRNQLRFEDVLFLNFDNGTEKGLNIALID